MTDYVVTSNVINSTADAVDLATNDTLYVAEGVLVEGLTAAVAAPAGHDGVALTIYGDLIGGNTGALAAINLGGLNDAVIIGDSGRVSSAHGSGVILNANSHLQNDGTIAAQDGDGLVLTGANNSIANSGMLQAVVVGIYCGGTAGPNFIDNTGTIEAGAEGIQQGTTAPLFVVNSGTISGYEGVFFDTPQNGDSSVTNSGTITADGGLFAVGDFGTGLLTLANTGTVTGWFSSAVAASGGGILHVTNGGQIEGNSGVFFDGASGDMLVNTGTISAINDAVDEEGGNLTLTNHGTLASNTAVHLGTASGTNTVTNTGAIDGQAYGVWQAGAGGLSVTNSGTIQASNAVVFSTTAGEDTLANTGLISAAQTAVSAVSGGALSVNNSGTITGAVGIAFQTASNHVDSLDNTGTVESTSSSGIAISDANPGALDITNSGHIVGDIVFGSGSDLYDGTLGSTAGVVNGGAGDDVLTGGAGRDMLDGGTGNDVIDGGGGNDMLAVEGAQTTVDGGDGSDVISMAAFFNAGDRIDGGAGKDTLILAGDYSAGVVLGEDTLLNVETVRLESGFNYKLTTNDATVAAGARLVVDASALGAGQELTFDGSAETDGHFLITGGAANDVLIGGAGNDTLIGGGDNNKFTGGLGADKIVATTAEHDTFIYTDVAQSTGLGHDVITDFSATIQAFDLDVTVTGVDATVTSGKLTAANFDANLATAVSAAHLAAGHAVLFTPTTGNFAGHTFLVVDANGIAGYQAGQDYVFDLVTAAHLNHLAVADFV